ncbi:hypothetical protein BJV78DRAFT_1284515 [Lactifluus subvellereus]|nr:hypothetical protein BJV78DRAFT_1284515 [Lactifluus subvellereus]
MCMTILELSHAEEVLGLIELALGGAVHVTVRGERLNYEVLELLRELEADHIARTCTAQRLKEDFGRGRRRHWPASAPSPDPPLTVSENLRTIEVEAIQYLTTDYQPTCVQTAQGVQCLTKNLAPFGLTKAEQLQVVNLTPVEPVELYVIVEELKDRLGNCMEEVLDVLMLEIVDETPAMPHDDMDLDAPLWEHDDNEIEYIDAGEGVGIEGDLDLEDE